MMHPPPGAFVHVTGTTSVRRKELQDSSAPVRILGWTVAALLTLGLHAGLYLLLTRRDTPPPIAVQEPAAVMVNLAPIAVSARSEVDNNQQGPPAEAQTKADPEPVEEAPPPPDPQPLLDVPPPPPDVKPQAALPPKPPKVVKPEKPVVKERPKKPIERPKPVEKREKPPEKRQRVATKAGGGPRSDRQTADVTASSAAGSAISEASRASWQNEVRAKIVRSKRFPSEARGQTGVSVVSVTFGANGSASGVRLVASSGNAALDAEAVAVMYRAAPYPTPPGGRVTTLTVPLNFRR